MHTGRSDETHTKVVICGSSSVGKTTLLQRILKKDISSTPSETMGVGFASIIYIHENRELPLNLWDTAGQEAFRSLVNIYFRNTEIAILVFDITVIQSFNDINRWIQEMNANCGDSQPDFILVGNKSDLKDNRALTIQQITDFAKSNNMSYFEVSAVENTGIEELMKEIGSLAVHHKDAIREMLDKTQNIDVPSEDKKKCC
ncbi:Ras-related protein RABH1c [Tritrichomonas foetus]|uniref:Ras-related protein RABH1c n=1 Tax=Tritrichomonas foetus TaxID=1144522 RepID=A0A1J4J6Z5_9EUKA|nr:Ras-related protein RABH1c [Tritrichomonas foetus]|eukprot:OHS93427.1 Ras-related protein RABH1c [Tritrichomonas foetus]